MALNHSLRSMELQWVVLGYVAAAEAIMLLLLTFPGLESLRVGLVTAVRCTLRPLLLLVPLCLFLLVQVCWQCVSGPPGDSEHGRTHSDNLRHEKKPFVESNLNAILIVAALLLYWLLFPITNLLLRVHQLGQQLETLKKKDRS